MSDFVSMVADKDLADCILKKPTFFPEHLSVQLLNVLSPDLNRKSVTFTSLKADCVPS